MRPQKSSQEKRPQREAGNETCALESAIGVGLLDQICKLLSSRQPAAER